MANFCECRKSSTRKARSEPSLQGIIAIHLAEKKEDFPGRGNRTETFPSKGQEGPCACLRGTGQGNLSEKQLRWRTDRAPPDFILSAGPFGTLFLNHKTLLKSLLGSLTCRRDERRTWPSRGVGAKDTPGHPPTPWKPDPEGPWST